MRHCVTQTFSYLWLKLAGRILLKFRIAIGLSKVTSVGTCNSPYSLFLDFFFIFVLYFIFPSYWISHQHSLFATKWFLESHIYNQDIVFMGTDLSQKCCLFYCVLLTLDIFPIPPSLSLCSSALFLSSNKASFKPGIDRTWVWPIMGRDYQLVSLL